jgi:hypothetical protein
MDATRSAAFSNPNAIVRGYTAPPDANLPAVVEGVFGCAAALALRRPGPRHRVGDRA